MKIRLSLAIAVSISFALAMQACSRPLPPQASCNFVQNAEQQRVSWKGRLPVKLYYHSSIPTGAYAALDKAVAEYNAHLGKGREIFRVVARGVDGVAEPRKDGNSMIYWMNTWDANKPTEQARTTIYWSGVQVFESDIRINAKNFDYYMGDASNFTNLDLTSLLVHELGHALGLAHNNASGSVMNFSLDQGQDRRKLTTTDIGNLGCEY